MTFNTISIIQQEVQKDFQELMASVQGAEAENCTADAMERHLFRQLLQLGANLMQMFLSYRSQSHQREAIINAEGKRVPYHMDCKRDYYSIFGKLDCRRPYFYQQGEGGYSPLDAALGLGADSYSDFLREVHEELSTYVPYEKAATMLGRLLDIHLSKRVQQQFMSSDAGDVDAYYEQKPAPEPAQEASILVAQVDGKGVPIVRPSETSEKVRLRRGEARSRKKAAVVTALYTIRPAPRTADDVLRTLLPQEQEEKPAPAARYRPQHKQIRGTMKGKDVALERLAQQVAKREGPHIQQRVALCDGDRFLQKKLLHYLPDFTLILDFIHAYEYLWKAANRLYEEDDPERLLWVQEQTRRLLTSQTTTVMETLRRLAQEEGRSTGRQKELRRVANYFEKNLAYMDYAAYLAHGWPIASGVIEGACRHFVKDRMELSGMRWTLAGAEDMLRLRAVAENDDWDDYHQFRKQRRQQRLYQCAWPTTPVFTLERPRAQPAPCPAPAARSDSSATAYIQLPAAA